MSKDVIDPYISVKMHKLQVVVENLKQRLNGCVIQFKTSKKAQQKQWEKKNGIDVNDDKTTRTHSISEKLWKERELDQEA